MDAYTKGWIDALKWAKITVGQDNAFLTIQDKLKDIMKSSENFKVGDIVFADNNPYNPHDKTIPWAKGKITKIRIDAGGDPCYYLEGAYTYFWRVIPFKENTKEWYLETNNGDYDKFIDSL